MLPELPLVERQTSLATPGPSLLVRIGQYEHTHRTVRASVSDGTCFRIGRYASATVISALLNGMSVRLFGASLSVGDIAVCVGSVVVIYACGFARGQPLSEIFCRAFTCRSFLVG